MPDGSDLTSARAGTRASPPAARPGASCAGRTGTGQVVITEKASQARDVRVAVGDRYV